VPYIVKNVYIIKAIKLVGFGERNDEFSKKIFVVFYFVVFAKSLVVFVRFTSIEISVIFTKIYCIFFKGIKPGF
jgi:hypothetical protein